MSRTRFFAVASLAVSAGILLHGCASAPRPVGARDFGPADEGGRHRALDAWKEALRRADSLPPSRLLYDLKYSKGAIRTSGTLAVVAPANGDVTATATGPFGTSMGEYRDGAFHIKNEQPFRLDPRLLRGILAGVWKGGAPEVAGADQGESLLRWVTPEGLVIEAVLDVAAARLTSLRARSPQGELSVAFPGPFEPWPTVIEIVSEKTGQALRLKRDLVEPIR